MRIKHYLNSHLTAAIGTWQLYSNHKLFLNSHQQAPLKSIATQLISMFSELTNP